jgi:hypothetical protein
MKKHINPLHIDLIEPLKRWKILSLNELKKEISSSISNASLYKVIKRLEDFRIIDSFIDSNSKKKYIYLDSNAKEYFDIDKSDYIPRDQRYHDALSIEVLRAFIEKNYAISSLTDVQLKEELTQFDHRPDGQIEVKSDKKIKKVAIELELNQKSKERISKYFDYYSNTKIFDYCVYIFANKFIFNRYIKHFMSHSFERNKIKFLYISDLKLNKIDLKSGQVYQDNCLKSFEEVFSSTDLAEGEHRVNTDPKGLTSIFKDVLTN